VSELNPGRDRNGPHHGTVDITGTDSHHEALDLAAAWISEFVDGRNFVMASHSTPIMIHLGDGVSRVAGWNVSIDWRVVS